MSSSVAVAVAALAAPVVQLARVALVTLPVAREEVAPMRAAAVVAVRPSST